MQGRVGCSTTDKLHPARQASFWSMKWFSGNRHGEPLVSSFLPLLSFLSSFTYRSIRFEFLVLALGLGHSFSSPTFAETKRVPVPIEASSVTTHVTASNTSKTERTHTLTTRTIIGRLIYQFPETDREAQSERNQPSAAFAVFTFGGSGPRVLHAELYIIAHVHMRVMHACRVEQ